MRLNVVDGLLVPFGEPVTVMGYVPVGVDSVVLMVSVLEHVGEHGLAVNVAVAPAGKLDVLSVIPDVAPETSVRVMVLFPEEPCVTVMFPLFESV